MTREKTEIVLFETKDKSVSLPVEIKNETVPHPTCSMELPEGSTFVITSDAAIRLVKSKGIVFE